MQKCPTCPRCSGFYIAKDAGRQHKRPLLLHCGHTFCESCVIQLSKEHKQNLLSCPTCKVESPLTIGEEGWRGLLPNRYMLGLVMHSQKTLLDMEMSKLSPAGMALTLRNRGSTGDSISISSDQPSQETRCSGCSKRNATCRCDKCDCTMCNSCFDNIHKMSSTLRQHTAVPLTGDSFSQLEIPQKCKLHDNRPVEYYCEDDDTIICSRCVIVGDHKGHNISSIEDKNKAVISEMEPNLQMANHVYRRLKKMEKDRTLSALAPDIKNEVSPALEELSTYFQHLHGVLQIREQALQKEVIQQYKAGLEPLENLMSSLQEESKKLDQGIKAAQKIMNNNSEVIINAKEILTRLEHAHDIPCIIELSEAQSMTEKIRFLPGTPLDELLIKHGCIEGEVKPRFSLFNMREKPEKFTEDRESLGSPLDSMSVASSVSEDVIIEDETVIFNDSSSQMSDSSCVSDKSKSSRTKARKRATKATSLANRPRHVKGHLQKVMVTHIHNPCRFMVQLKSDLAKVDALSSNMNGWCRTSASDSQGVTGVDIDDLVLCKYSRDNRWYRARIKNVIPPQDEDFANTKVEVHYIDYGNTEIVPVTRLKNMQPKFMKHPKFAVECCLFDVVSHDKSGSWSKEAVQTFAKMVENKTLLLLVNREENNILHVDLSKPADQDIIDDVPISVRDAMVFLELANIQSPQSVPVPGYAAAPSRDYIKPEPAIEGQEYEMIVSYAGTPHCFFVQELGEESLYLANMMKEMQETYTQETRDSLQLLSPQIGMICISQFSSDGMWYRARVVNLPGNKMVDVQYVDYGNTERVPVYSLRKIIDTYLKLPAQAIQCQLTDVEPISVWTDEGLRFWSDLVTMKAFIMKVTGVGSPLYVVLRDRDTNYAYSINTKLVDAGHGQSVGKWSEPTHFDDSKLQSGLAAEVPRLTYSQTSDSFPTLAKPGSVNESVHRKNVPVSRRAQLDPILTPPSSPPPSRRDTLGGQSPNSSTTASPRQQPSNTTASTSASIPTASTSKVTKDSGTVGGMKEVEVVISHFESPSKFMLQVADDQSLDELMNALSEKYRNSEATATSWDVDTFCAVKSVTDHRWYRGRITKAVQNKLYEVCMIDYGFTEMLPATNIRKISKLLRKRSCFAFPCHLANLTPAGGTQSWSKTASEFMQEKAAVGKLYISKKGNTENKSLPVDLIVEQYVEETALEPGRKVYNSLIDMMKEQGLAIPVKSKSKKKPVESPKVYPVQYYTNNIPVTEKKAKVLPVYVDFDGVIYFYTMGGDIQFQTLNQGLFNKFNMSDPHPTSQTWVKGQASVCYYTKDQAWCRATILSVEPQRVQVHYVDFGNSEWVGYEKLRADVDDFLNLPIQTHQCVLHDLYPVEEGTDWPEAVLEYLHKELVNKYCEIKIMECPEDRPLQVTLRCAKKDVSTHLIQYGLARTGIYLTDEEKQSVQIQDVLQKNCPYTLSEVEAVGESITVLVTHVELPNVVYIQHTHIDIKDDMSEERCNRAESVNTQLDQLLQLAIDINKVAPSLPSIPIPKTGMACCAQYGLDHCWYRAVIIDIVPETGYILVLFVDYGNSEFATLNKIRALPPKYQTLPCQSVRCLLSDVTPATGVFSWTKQSLLAMMTSLVNKPITTVIKRHKPVLSVDLFDAEESLAYQSVIDQGLVEKNQQSSLSDVANCGDNATSENSSDDNSNDDDDDNKNDNNNADVDDSDNEGSSDATMIENNRSMTNWASIVEAEEAEQGQMEELGERQVLDKEEVDEGCDTDDPDVIIEEEEGEVIEPAVISTEIEECFD